MFSDLLPLLNISPAPSASSLSPSCSMLFPAHWATSPHLSATSVSLPPLLWASPPPPSSGSRCPPTRPSQHGATRPALKLHLQPSPSYPTLCKPVPPPLLPHPSVLSRALDTHLPQLLTCVAPFRTLLCTCCSGCFVSSGPLPLRSSLLLHSHPKPLSSLPPQLPFPSLSLLLQEWTQLFLS